MISGSISVFDRSVFIMEINNQREIRKMYSLLFKIYKFLVDVPKSLANLNNLIDEQIFFW